MLGAMLLLGTAAVTAGCTDVTYSLSVGGQDCIALGGSPLVMAECFNGAVHTYDPYAGTPQPVPHIPCTANVLPVGGTVVMTYNSHPCGVAFTDLNGTLLKAYPEVCANVASVSPGFVGVATEGQIHIFDDSGEEVKRVSSDTFTDWYSDSHFALTALPDRSFLIAIPKCPIWKPCRVDVFTQNGTKLATITAPEIKNVRFRDTDLVVVSDVRQTVAVEARVFNTTTWELTTSTDVISHSTSASVVPVNMAGTVAAAHQIGESPGIVVTNLITGDSVRYCGRFSMLAVEGDVAVFGSCYSSRISVVVLPSELVPPTPALTPREPKPPAVSGTTEVILIVMGTVLVAASAILVCYVSLANRAREGMAELTFELKEGEAAA